MRQPALGRAILVLTLISVSLMKATPSSAGFFQDLVSGNGGADPFNKNNNLGVVIKMPQAPPPSVTRFDDPPSYSRIVDNHGRIFQSVNGGTYQYIGNANKQEYPNGQTYFQLPGQKAVIADPTLWDHQRINQLNQQAIAKQHYEQQQKQRADAHQQLIQMQQNIINTPFDQVLAEVQNLPDQQLIEAKVRLGILIQYVKAQQLADTTGFERLLVALNDEASRRTAIAKQQAQQAQPQPQPHPVFPALPDGAIFAANLGISYVRLNNADGTFNARVVGEPRPNSPAAQIGLEDGDVIFELDGMRFDQPQDVLGHRFQTEIGFIDVRSKDEKHYQIYIP